MATLVENAIRIKQTFDDIHDAIVEQGVTPSGGVDTYAEAIDNIARYIEPSNVDLIYVAWGGYNTSTAHTTSINMGAGESYSNYISLPSSGVWTCNKTGNYLFVFANGVHTSGIGADLAVTITFYIGNTVARTIVLSGGSGSHCDYSVIPLSAANTFRIACTYNKAVSSCRVSGFFRAYYIGVTSL